MAPISQWPKYILFFILGMFRALISSPKTAHDHATEKTRS